MARLLMSTSYDPNFPPENVLTTNTKEFWMSTGLYPQELVFQLNSPSAPRSIRLVCSNVRHVIIEGCEGTHLGSFNKIGETEFGSNNGELQKESVDIATPKQINFIKLVIMSGWDEYISVHSVRID